MDKLRAAYRVSVIIGLVMMASLLVTTIIVGILEKDPSGLHGVPALSGRELEIMKFALLGISAVLFFLIRFINARVPAAGGEEGGRPGARPGTTPGAPPEFGRLATAAIVTYALCEAPAIFGLVLFFLGRDSSDFHVFLLISLFFFAVHFPRFGQWEEWYRKQGHGPGKRRI